MTLLASARFCASPNPPLFAIRASVDDRGHTSFSRTLRLFVYLAPLLIEMPTSGSTGEGPEPASKVAVTERAWLIVTVQLPVPEQPSPLQPAKVDSEAGDAVSVTDVPSANEAEQLEPQSIAAGEEVTEPDPVPDFVTVRAYANGLRAGHCGPTVPSKPICAEYLRDSDPIVVKLPPA